MSTSLPQTQILLSLGPDCWIQVVWQPRSACRGRARAGNGPDLRAGEGGGGLGGVHLSPVAALDAAACGGSRPPAEKWVAPRAAAARSPVRDALVGGTCPSRVHRVEAWMGTRRRGEPARRGWSRRCPEKAVQCLRGVADAPATCRKLRGRSALLYRSAAGWERDTYWRGLPSAAPTTIVWPTRATRVHAVTQRGTKKSGGAPSAGCFPTRTSAGPFARSGGRSDTVPLGGRGKGGGCTLPRAWVRWLCPAGGVLSAFSGP